MNPRAMWACVVLFAGCTPAPMLEVEAERPAPLDANFDRLSLMLKGIGAGEMSLYEGLPSEFWEPQVRERELKRKQTLKWQGHPFYEPPLELTTADAEQLTAVLSAPDSYRRYRAAKTCGGDHADYCVEWKTDETAAQVLISLECAEVAIFGPDGGLKCDFSPAAAQKLKSLLSSYQQHRPASESGP